jgi:hypothetical protein
METPEIIGFQGKGDPAALRCARCEAGFGLAALSAEIGSRLKSVFLSQEVFAFAKKYIINARWRPMAAPLDAKKSSCGGKRS